MDFSGVNAHLVDVQNELNLLAAEDVARDTALTQTQNALNVANVENAALKARIAELEAQQQPPPEPQRHVLWGASTAWAPTHHGTHNKEEEARYLEKLIGRPFDISRHYHQTVNGLPETWMSDNCKDSVASGREIMFTFTSAGKTWAQVANNALDAHIHSQAQMMLSAGGTWLKAWIAFENEPEPEANAEGGSKGTAADYVRAAEHIADRIRLEGLADVRITTALMEWTWRNKARDPEAWIPNGITHLGVHRYFYNLGSCGTSWPRPSFYDGLKAVHATAEAHGVRLGVWEGGQQEDMHNPNPDFKANWCRAIPADMEKLPLLDAFTWWHSGGKEGPFAGTCAWERGIRIDSTAKALAGYAEAGKAPILTG